MWQKKNIEDLLIMLLIIDCLFARSFRSMFIAEYINFARTVSCENRIDIKMSILDLHNSFSSPSGSRFFHASCYGISLGFIFCNFLLRLQQILVIGTRDQMRTTLHIYYNGKEIATLFIGRVCLSSNGIISFFFSDRRCCFSPNSFFITSTNID